ncbi:Transcription elongation factor TFIIS [Porphyridium purpureum]|uniref:Transcription elongation factor TFIIS n=1 Tax=Porphyridium purpureum TaxID=35688 RepID=A0A5J4Z653_PORPP|nr:Transcription elongation factor TFIIS [Porphyridium purpureum]|eukprot:POR9139..scf295_1
MVRQRTVWHLMLMHTIRNSFSRLSLFTRSDGDSMVAVTTRRRASKEYSFWSWNTASMRDSLNTEWMVSRIISNFLAAGTDTVEISRRRWSTMKTSSQPTLTIRNGSAIRELMVTTRCTASLVPTTQDLALTDVLGQAVCFARAAKCGDSRVAERAGEANAAWKKRCEHSSARARASMGSRNSGRPPNLGVRADSLKTTALSRGVPRAFVVGGRGAAPASQLSRRGSGGKGGAAAQAAYGGALAKAPTALRSLGSGGNGVGVGSGAKDKLRSKAVETFGKSLCQEIEGRGDGEGASGEKADPSQAKHATDKEEAAAQAKHVAERIECAVYAKYQQSIDEYKDKCRELNFNLRDPLNAELRQKVLQGALSAEELVNMSSDELANEQEKKVKEEIKEQCIRDAQPFNAPPASTDQFRCGKCRQRKCTYYQMQTRSADEPLTTFVTCVNCNNRWKM